MEKAKVTSKGQITIPKAVRKDLDLRPGDEVEFVRDDGIYRLRRVVDESVFDKWVGYLEHLRGRDPDEVVEEMRGR